MTQRRSLLALAATIVLVLCGTSQAALVGLWRFDGDTNDISGFNNHGTLMNGAVIGADNSPVGGGSLFVNGGSQHLRVAHDSTLNIVGESTIAAWVRTVGNIGWDGVLAKNPSSNGSANNHAGNYELRIENGSRVPTYLYQQGGVNDTIGINTPGAIPNDVWTHVAVTTSNGQARFYINGALTNTVGLDVDFGKTNFNPLYIGSRADLFTVMNGRLDDVAIFDHALSQAEIQSIRTGNFAGYPGNGKPIQIITGVTATASSQLLGGFERSAANVVNGAGFSEASGTHSNGLEGVAWLNTGNGAAGGGADLNPSITFDLGSVKNVQDMLVWNYNETDVVDLTTRGVNNATVQISTDGVFFTTLFDTNFLEAPGTNNVDYHQTVPLNTSFRFLRLTNLTNHGDVNNFIGLSEVRFVEAIPEPATLSMLGLAGLALLRRRRSA